MADTARIAEGLALVRGGRGFDAHELFEELWRAAEPAERDLYQGLVHVAVATYQDGRGNAVGRTRQLEKALRRLGAVRAGLRGRRDRAAARLVPRVPCRSPLRPASVNERGLTPIVHGLRCGASRGDTCGATCGDTCGVARLAPGHHRQGSDLLWFGRSFEPFL